MRGQSKLLLLVMFFWYLIYLFSDFFVVLSNHSITLLSVLSVFSIPLFAYRVAKRKISKVEIALFIGPLLFFIAVLIDLFRFHVPQYFDFSRSGEYTVIEQSKYYALVESGSGNTMLLSYLPKDPKEVLGKPLIITEGRTVRGIKPLCVKIDDCPDIDALTVAVGSFLVK